MRQRIRITTCTYHVTKIINAPLRFVFGWCTDYREDDNKLTGSKTKRTILEKTKHRAVYVIEYPDEKQIKIGFNLVTLSAPYSWHLDYFGQDDDEIADYALVRLGPRKTRLDMVFTEKWKIRKVPEKAIFTKHISQIWDKYVAALERDYAKTTNPKWGPS
ncbi:MAG: hypothetical protein ABSF82_10550 [Candidatus Bathyarchaeia archaeon]|jgi:hypothetical protein